MDWYAYLATILIFTQVLYCALCYRNYRFVQSKVRKVRRPTDRTAFIVPCKGLDEQFEKNITSFFTQDHCNYVLWFVVQDERDPAYAKLAELKDKLAQRTTAKEVRVLVAGHARGCSQKLHNMLHACRLAGEDTMVFAFADSDICVRSGWLGHLVHPLRKRDKYGAASGYRLFVPSKINPATLALASMNARVAQMLGPSGFNHAWGGSMAIRRDMFIKLNIEAIWKCNISDDLSLSRAVKRAGLNVAFVPACLVASYVSITWRRLLEFGRRQFLITRVTAPTLWTIGLLGSLYSVAGFWGGTAAAIYAIASGLEHPWVYMTVPGAFLAGHFWKAGLRWKTMSVVLDNSSKDARAAARADIFLSWLWSPLLLGIILSSALGRTLTWRGIRYKLHGPDKVQVLSGE
ncbi:MAG TPA: glycosyltransferase [Sedimentisphaerales bacterium]|nr:glycosyltransferase [Sedimentisphaerales bacterium]